MGSIIGEVNAIIHELGLNADLIITLIVLLGSVILFLSNRIRSDVVALLIIVVLAATAVLTPGEAFSGLSRNAVITMFAIFILAEGLQRTGVTEKIGEILLQVGGTGEARLVAIVMLGGAFLSLLMNNIAAAAVLLPAVAGAARKSRVSASRLLMPLAFSTLLGGMATLFTTSNIVVSNVLRDQGYEQFGVLDFAPVGIPVVIVGIAFLALWGRRQLPDTSPVEQLEAMQHAEGDLVTLYRLGERLFRARVPRGSILVGRPLAETPLRETYGVTVVAVEHNGQMLLTPAPTTVCAAGDVLTLQGDIEDFRKLDTEPYLEILPARSWKEVDLESPTVVVVEAILMPRSRLIGQTLKEVHFRDKYGMTTLAIWRAGRPIRRNLANRPLEFGDALLLQGPRSRMTMLQNDPDLIVLQAPPAELRPTSRKGWLAVAIMATSVIVAAVGILPTAEAMLAGALAMVLVGILTMEEVYRAVDWRSIFIVAGILPLSLALTKTGAAELLANGLVTVFGPLGNLALLGGVLLMTVLLTQVMSGQAVGAILAPIAIQAAVQTQLDPRSLAMAVALGTGMAFLTPLGHPVNLLVMGAGGYQFRDYWRVGWLLTVLVFLVIMIVLPIFWPLTGR
ncbi:MAG: SLC13 family permease [Anaerolineae bacterium]